MLEELVHFFSLKGKVRFSNSPFKFPRVDWRSLCRKRCVFGRAHRVFGRIRCGSRAGYLCEN